MFWPLHELRPPGKYQATTSLHNPLHVGTECIHASVTRVPDSHTMFFYPCTLQLLSPVLTSRKKHLFETELHYKYRINLLSTCQDLWLQEWIYHRKHGRKDRDLGGTKAIDSFIGEAYAYLSHQFYLDHGTSQQFSHTVHLFHQLVQCHCVVFSRDQAGAWASPPSHQRGSKPYILSVHEVHCDTIYTG